MTRSRPLTGRLALLTGALTALAIGAAALAWSGTLPPSRSPAERHRAAQAPAHVDTVPVLVGAGDIADCDFADHQATAKLVDGIEGTVFTLGDAAYPRGAADDFEDCYGTSWGRFKDRTMPVPGNHEYKTDKAVPYFDYFGKAAGDPGYGYYAYELGGWLVLALNSNCDELDCGPDSAQAAWLREELAMFPGRCQVAMWHHPLFTSGRRHSPETRLRPLFQILYDGGVEAQLAGHNHQYERFEPVAPDGTLDRDRGVRPFVVGTGGAKQYQFRSPLAANSATHSNDFGVLKLTLHDSSYDWSFISTGDGEYADSGSADCH